MTAIAGTTRLAASDDEMKKAIERGLCTVRKKGMSPHVPALNAHDRVGVDAWASGLVDALGLRDTLDGVHENIEAVLRHSGTHGFKIPKATVTTPPIFSSLNRVGAPEGILSEGMLPDVVTYFGNAALARHAKLLLARLDFDGIRTQVMFCLAEGVEHPVSRALIALGLPAETCELAMIGIHQKRSADLSRVAIHPELKQVYFEEEGQDDVLIVPVHPIAMHAELMEHMHHEDRWVRNRAISAVGGVNPINGGLLCGDIGGRFNLFMAEPPHRTSQGIADRLQRGGRVYVRWFAKDNEFAINTFVDKAITETEIGNSGQRKEERNLYDWFASILGRVDV